MSLLKDILFGFPMQDFWMLVTSLIGSLVVLCLSPLLYLVNAFRTKTFPQPRVVVITGASSGIGYGLALRYAEAGVTLGLTGRNAERLEEIKSECQKKAPGVKVVIGKVNTSDANAMRKFLTDIDDKSPVDLIIANAGASELTLPANVTYEEKVRELFNVNTTGVLNALLPLLPRMRARQHGQLVIVSSLSTYIGVTYPAYVGSKSAVTGYGITLRNELAPYGIGVTVVSPGFVETRMSEKLGRERLEFVVSSEYAAQCIASGLTKNPAHIAFPTPTLLFSYFVSLIPPNLRDCIQTLVTKIMDAPSDTILYTTERDQIKQSSSREINEKLLVRQERVRSSRGDKKIQ